MDNYQNDGLVGSGAAPSPERGGLNLPFSDDELRRLVQRIERDHLNALAAHDVRVRRFAEFEAELWQLVEVTPPEDSGRSNYKVPLLAWVLWRWVADMAEKIFGDDGEVRAEPTEPSDKKSAKLASEFIQWAFFSDMKADLPVIQTLADVGLLGRAHVYMPWRKHTYLAKNPETGEIGEVEKRSGPCWEPIHPDDLIVPAEPHARSIHEFSFVERRFYTTPQHLLDDERDGMYFGVSDPDDASVFQDLVRTSSLPMVSQRTWGNLANETRDQQDRAQGIDSNAAKDSGSEVIEVIEWYGRWRPELPTEVDGGVVVDGKARWPDQMELRVTIIPALGRIIGVHDLMDLYPTRCDRRPIESIGLFAKGVYWCPGIAQLLRWSWEELTANHNLLTDAVGFATMPPGVYEPAAGMDFKAFRWEPGVMEPVADVNKVRQMPVTANFNGVVLKEQMVLAYVERLFGISDQALGRSSDKPNDPKTATGQALQDAGGNKRMNLDVKVIREQLNHILSRVWELYRNFADKDLYFRVLGEDPSGILDMKDGFAKVSPDTLASTYDFNLKFASTYYSREMEKQRAMEVYGLMMQNPLVQMNPPAMWHVTNELWTALGRRDLASVLPPPGPVDLPKRPVDEWNMLLQGQPIKVHPMDNDQEHIQEFETRISQAGPEQQAVVEAALVHVMAHREQLQMKIAAQGAAMAQGLMMQAAAAQQGQQQGGQSNAETA